MTGPWKVLVVAAALLAALSLLAAGWSASTIQSQRAESIRLLCSLNRAFGDFVKAPPDLPRDRPALVRLRAERCRQLLDDVR